MKEKEDKQGFLQSFTGKFKKVSLDDDEPDELMLKYGDIKLKGPTGQEEQSGIHGANSSFFFSDGKGGREQEAGGQEMGMTQEISGILDALKNGRGPIAQQHKPQESHGAAKEKEVPAELKPIGVTQEVNGILEALGRSNKISRPDEPDETPKAQTWTPKKEEFSEAFERIKNAKDNDRMDDPQYGTREIARIISEVTGEKTEAVRPVELIPQRTEDPAPVPQPVPQKENATEDGVLRESDEAPFPQEAGEEEEEIYSGPEEYEEYPEDTQPKVGFGQKLKAFFKNLVTMPEAQQGEDPFAEDDWEEEAPIPQEETAAEDLPEEKKEDFSIRPELFFWDDEEENITEKADKPKEKETVSKPEQAPRASQPEEITPEEPAGRELEETEENTQEEPAPSEKEKARSKEGEPSDKEEPEAGEFSVLPKDEVQEAGESPEAPEKISEEAEAAGGNEDGAPVSDEPAGGLTGGTEEPSEPEAPVASSREKQVSRYEKAFGKVKPASAQKSRVIRVDPKAGRTLTAKEAAKMYCERRDLPAIDLSGMPLAALLQEENQTAAQVTVVAESQKQSVKTSKAVPSAKEEIAGKTAVQAVTINLADLQAGKKIRHHENTRLFHYAPELAVVNTAAGKFGENLRAECAMSRQALQKKEQEERKRLLEREEKEPLEPVKKKRPKEKAPKRRFAIFSSQEEEDPEDVMPQPQPVEIVEDYAEPSDAFAIKKEIFKNMKNLLIRTVVLAGLMILSVVVTVMARLNLPDVPDVFITNSYLYLGVSLALLAVAGAVSLTTLKNGFLSVPRLKGNSDAPVAFAWTAAALQIIIGFFSAGRFTNTDLSLYANLAVLALLLNAWGKLMIVRRVHLNFKFICSPDEKYAAKIYNDRESAVEMCRGMGAGEPIIAYQKKTGFLSNFLQLSYEPDPSEKFAGKISFLSAGLSLVLGVVSFILTKDLYASVSAFALSLCVCVPMCTMLAMNFPVFRLCKKISKLDAMVVGYPGIRQFADTNVVVLDCNTLFPRNAVVLHEVKAFETRLLDKALLEAAAMLKAVDSPLYHVFEQIVSEERQLPPVDSLSYEDERGLMGWVRGKRVLVGNRSLLENHGVAPPDRSVELEHTQNGRQVTYIASAGELVAMLVTNYDFSPTMKQELQRLEDNGVAFLVSTTDPNVTAKLVSDRFGLFFRSVKVLGGEYAKRFKELEGEQEASTRVYLATKGRVNVLARVLAACVRVRGNMTAAMVLQRLTVLLSFLMVAFLTVISGVAQIGALEITLYSIFWVVVTLLVSVIRKP